MKKYLKLFLFGFWIWVIPLSIGFSNTEEKTVDPRDQIQLNFEKAPLKVVLDYLSKAAGFVIVMQAEVNEKISVTSHQPISRTEAVELINNILITKGYAAIRKGRILTIVPRDAAKQSLIPVQSGRDPLAIPAKDEIVTQIIPVRYADVKQLIDNLSPLLPEQASLTANESSNALVLTDTLSNIRRIMEIVIALDTSISDISSLKVFPLKFAKAKEVSEVIKNVFTTEKSSTQNNRNRGRWDRAARRFRSMMMGGGGNNNRSSSSGGGQNNQALQQALTVTAVPDERTNSVIVSAPDSMIPLIEELILEVDRDVDDLVDIQVFELKHADPVELAELLTKLFDTSNQSSSNSRNNRNRNVRYNRRGGQQNQSTSMSEDARVVAVADQRTASVIVTAPKQMMPHIQKMIERLDSIEAREQKVYIHSLDHADVNSVSDLLSEMFSENGVRRTNNNTNQNNALRNRRGNFGSAGSNNGNNNNSSRRR